jgi:hypothetical protein
MEGGAKGIFSLLPMPCVVGLGLGLGVTEKEREERAFDQNTTWHKDKTRQRQYTKTRQDTRCKTQDWARQRKGKPTIDKTRKTKQQNMTKKRTEDRVVLDTGQTTFLSCVVSVVLFLVMF